MNLAVGEVEVLATHFPEPGVGLWPAPAGQVDDLAQLGPEVPRDLAAVDRPHEDGVEELSVDVELDLVLGTVAQAHGCGLAIPLEVLEIDLVSGGVAFEVVEDLQPLVQRQVGHPLHEVGGLLDETTVGTGRTG